MSYNFPAGDITMAEIVRLANEHGMYFSDLSRPIFSRISFAEADGVFQLDQAFPNDDHIIAQVSLSLRSDIKQWIDANKTVVFMACANAWGIVVPKVAPGEPTDTPHTIKLEIMWGGVWIETPAPVTTPFIGWQTPDASPAFAGPHMQYAIAGSGEHAADTSPSDFVTAVFTVRLGDEFANPRPLDIDMDKSWVKVSLCLLEVLKDTAGLT